MNEYLVGISYWYAEGGYAHRKYIILANSLDEAISIAKDRMIESVGLVDGELSVSYAY